MQFRETHISSSVMIQYIGKHKRPIILFKDTKKCSITYLYRHMAVYPIAVHCWETILVVWWEPLHMVLHRVRTFRREQCQMPNWNYDKLITMFIFWFILTHRIFLRIDFHSMIRLITILSAMDISLTDYNFRFRHTQHSDRNRLSKKIYWRLRKIKVK